MAWPAWYRQGCVWMMLFDVPILMLGGKWLAMPCPRPVTMMMLMMMRRMVCGTSNHFTVSAMPRGLLTLQWHISKSRQQRGRNWLLRTVKQFTLRSYCRLLWTPQWCLTGTPLQLIPWVSSVISTIINSGVPMAQTPLELSMWVTRQVVGLVLLWVFVDHLLTPLRQSAGGILMLCSLSRNKTKAQTRRPRDWLEPLYHLQRQIPKATRTVPPSSVCMAAPVVEDTTTLISSRLCCAVVLLLVRELPRRKHFAR